MRLPKGNADIQNNTGGIPTQTQQQTSLKNIGIFSKAIAGLDKYAKYLIFCFVMEVSQSLGHTLTSSE